MTSRPALSIDFEPRFCGSHVTDLTAGCSFACIYCPFAAIGARRRGVSRPTAVDLSGLDEVPVPPFVFLSPASDAFAPQAVEGTHALLSRLLPRGTAIGVVTKGIIPDRTADLLAEHRAQIEGVAIGVTSLDDVRNDLLEPGCPPARERLENVDRLAARGIPSAVRLDPLFPLLDDEPSALVRLAKEATARGAYALTATYVFAWGRLLRRMLREPLLAASCALLTERAPMEGGVGFSVPLARKLATYAFLDQTAREHGLWFNTCGCKDLRVRESGQVYASCRNVFFPRAAAGWSIRSATLPVPALATPAAPLGALPA